MRWLHREPPEIEEACESASRIINGMDRAVDIVDRNRALYSRETTQRELIDLNEIIREMVILLRDTARRHSISIRSAGPGVSGKKRGQGAAAAGSNEPHA